jgi:oligoendopeptidase F
MDDPKIEVDLKTAENLIATLVSHRGTLATFSSEQLLTLIKDWEAVQAIFNDIGVYSSLLAATNIGVPDVTRFEKKIEERLVTIYEPLLYIEAELAQLSEEQWQSHLRAPELQPYRKLIEKIYVESKHTLTENEERVLSQKSLTSRGALTHLFSITTDTLEFDWDGKLVTLEEVITKFTDADSATRKKAAQVLTVGLNINAKTTPAILNSLVQDKAITDRLRHYKSPEQARYNSDDTDSETVEAMATAVSNSYATVERYYNLKKNILGADKLYWWDRYAPLPEITTKIPREEGWQMVIDAFDAFSPEMGQMVRDMDAKQHIDWEPSKTKRGGAFCAFGGKTIYPYVLLNYTNSPRDVMTVAHELGHAIHDIYASQDNVFLEIHPSLALAEIASTFGESLLFDRLVNSESVTKQDRISLLMASIEDRFATVYRQVSMFRFEQALHRHYRTEGELSSEQLNQLWDETMKEPFASSLTYTEEHKNTWMYVGHIFYTPYYVYTYAFAQLCTLALVQQYKEQGSEFIPKYVEILKAGGSLSPKDNLARAGLDISKPEFWQKGLQAIDGMVTELETLIRE